jgi:hypothetical protein
VHYDFLTFGIGLGYLRIRGAGSLLSRRDYSNTDYAMQVTNNSTNKQTNKQTPLLAGCGVQLVSVPALDNIHQAGEGEGRGSSCFSRTEKETKESLER